MNERHGNDGSPTGLSGADRRAARWRKSSHSTANGNCVEVAGVPGAVAVRDSKDPDGPALVVTPAGWVSFLDAVRAGRFRAG